jgi:hypothetical protein
MNRRVTRVSAGMWPVIAKEMPIDSLAGRPAVFVPLIRMRRWEQTR